MGFCHALSWKHKCSEMDPAWVPSCRRWLQRSTEEGVLVYDQFFFLKKWGETQEKGQGSGIKRANWEMVRQSLKCPFETSESDMYF